MSKNKKKDGGSGGEVPIDFQVESKNLQYTITLKDNEISMLKKEHEKETEYIRSLEQEIAALKKDYVERYKLENEIKDYRSKIEHLEMDIENLKQTIIDNKKKADEEKKTLEQNLLDQIAQLKAQNDSFKQKVEMVNQLLQDKESLSKLVEELNKKNEDIIYQNNEVMKQKDVKNQIKFSNLKKKMMDKIDQIQAKETELNIQYMDVSTKLTLLQNHQLLIQLEYQSQQLEEITSKKEALEKKVFELTKDIEIHKEVELSLAEKNKKLKNENLKLKNSKGNINSPSDNQNINSKIINTNTTEDEKSSSEMKAPLANSCNNYSTTVENNNSSALNNKSNNLLNNNSYTRMLNLEKKVLNLEKKLNNSKRDYNSLKDKNEYVEKILKNYEKKYSGLFNFFEDCLNQFFNDEDLTNNQEIFVNIDSIQRCDFTALSLEEKYSTLVILMKYLMPLINTSDVLNQQNNNINNVNLKFHLSNKKQLNDDYNFMKNKKKGGKNLNINTNSDNVGGSNKNAGDVLPSITANNYGNGNI